MTFIPEILTTNDPKFAEAIERGDFRIVNDHYLTVWINEDPEDGYEFQRPEWTMVPKAEPGVIVKFNPFAFTHEQNMELLAKGYEPEFTVPLDVGPLDDPR